MRRMLTGLACCWALSAQGQGLYRIAPYDDEARDTLPLSYTVGASVGYDDFRFDWPNLNLLGTSASTPFVTSIIASSLSSGSGVIEIDWSREFGLRPLTVDDDNRFGFFEGGLTEEFQERFRDFLLRRSLSGVSNLPLDSSSNGQVTSVPEPTVFLFTMSSLAIFLRRRR